MDSTPDKTPSKEEQIRELLLSARKDLETSAAKQLELTHALEGLLDWTKPDDQLAENLERKMDTAVDHSEPVRFEPLDTSGDSRQVILESSERSAFRPSRRDTNSPEEVRSVQRGVTQDVRGRTRPGHVQDHLDSERDHERDKIECLSVAR